MHILVLDACSRDHTVQFARAAGANVIQREWTDFVDARTFALSQVTTPWTLMIDADEALDDVLCDSILSASGEPNGYRLRRTTYFCGKPMRVWRNEPLLRLFRTGTRALAGASGRAEATPQYTKAGSATGRRRSCPERCCTIRTPTFRPTASSTSATRRSRRKRAAAFARARLYSRRRRAFPGCSGCCCAKAHCSTVRAAGTSRIVRRSIPPSRRGKPCYDDPFARRPGRADDASDVGRDEDVRAPSSPRACLASLPEYEYVAFSDGGNFGWNEQVRLPLAMRRARLDLIHFLALYVPLVVPARFVITIHDLIHLRFPQYFKAKVTPYYHTVVRWACARASRVITDDARTVDDLVELLGVDRA